LPADGPFVRLEGSNRFGDLWLCGHCQEIALSVNRMMSLRLYEQRVSELKAHVDTETSRLQAETLGCSTSSVSTATHCGL
jgi:hypothetical protein